MIDPDITGTAATTADHASVGAVKDFDGLGFLILAGASVLVLGIFLLNDWMTKRFGK